MKSKLFHKLAFTLGSTLALVIGGVQPAVAKSCETHDLLAGQTIDVGTLTICSDGTVTFQTEEPWLLGETHLQVADSIDGIPQTKNGNPIPGKFMYSNEPDSPVDSITFSGFDISDSNVIAAHAEVLASREACIDFGDTGVVEGQQVSDVITDNGTVSFSMIESGPLSGLSVGDQATFNQAAAPNDYPIVAVPDTGAPGANVMAFTVKSDNGLRDDYVSDANGTGAGGNTLTDPQDISREERLWHVFSQGLAISADFSTVPGLQEVSFAAVDLDFGETWQFQFFDRDDDLLEQVTLSCDNVDVECPGDGKAFPVRSSAPGAVRFAAWGGDNLGVAERIGYAIDNVCTTAVEEETAWGDGEAFPGRNWATYVVYPATD